MVEYIHAYHSSYLLVEVYGSWSHAVGRVVSSGLHAEPFMEGGPVAVRGYQGHGGGLDAVFDVEHCTGSRAEHPLVQVT